MSTFPFPNDDEAVETWNEHAKALDDAVKEDLATIDQALEKCYGRRLTIAESQLAQMLLLVVAKSTHRLTLAIVNTYLCTDRAKREQLDRIRARMDNPPEPEES